MASYSGEITGVRVLLPVSLDLSKLAIAVAGNGPQTLKRVRALDAAGAETLTVFAPLPAPDLVEAAGGRLVRRLPTRAELGRFRIVFIGDMPVGEAAPIAEAVRAHGGLVNVEDVLPLCDFHMPAIVRRGDLVISVSTGGKSPALAQAIKADIESRYTDAWDQRLQELADARARWKSEGLLPADIAERSKAHITAAGWLS